MRLAATLLTLVTGVIATVVGNDKIKPGQEPAPTKVLAFNASEKKAEVKASKKGTSINDSIFKYYGSASNRMTPMNVETKTLDGVDYSTCFAVNRLNKANGTYIGFTTEETGVMVVYADALEDVTLSVYSTATNELVDSKTVTTELESFSFKFVTTGDFYIESSSTIKLYSCNYIEHANENVDADIYSDTKDGNAKLLFMGYVTDYDVFDTMNFTLTIESVKTNGSSSTKEKEVTRFYDELLTDDKAYENNGFSFGKKKGYMYFSYNVVVQTATNRKNEGAVYTVSLNIDGKKYSSTSITVQPFVEA